MVKHKISIIKALDSTKAVSREKGQIIYELIKINISNDDEVVLDFKGVTDLTTAFLNVAIGHLYNDFNSEILNKKLELANITKLDAYLIKKAIKVAKMKSKSNFNLKLKEEFEDGKC